MEMTYFEKLSLLAATFYGRARDWYDSFQRNQQVNYQLLVQQFEAKYNRRYNVTKLHDELFCLRMSSTIEYDDYKREFIEL